MNEFLPVLGIALLASFLTYLGVPLAELFHIPQIVVSAALQLAAGVLAAIVALTLMPPAVEDGPLVATVLAFFVGGALFVWIEYAAAQRQRAQPAGNGASGSSGLYIGILVDLAIDGVVIGIGSTVTLSKGLLLALGIAISTLPLAFVTTAIAKQQGVPPERRRRLSILMLLCIIGGAMLGYLLLRQQPLAVRLVLIALASGFLITTITQSMIPEANRDGEPSFAGLFFVGGLSLYALLTLGLA